MKRIHFICAACTVAALALWMAGQANAAALVFVLSFAVEWLGAALHGKQGNDTER